MTDNPPDLIAFRTEIRRLTGLGPLDIGILGNQAHIETGGYHEGKDDLASVGLYHPHAAVGSHDEDYSVRLKRDRDAVTNFASAMDIGDDWPNGGRDAWKRFNGLLLHAIQHDHPAMTTVRAINYSPDGILRKRVDREAGVSHIQDSTDNVEIHTHIEWYRDTQDRRQDSFDRLLLLIDAAINNTDPEDDMTPEEHNRLVNIDESINKVIAMTSPARLTVGDQPNELRKILTTMASDARTAATRPSSLSPEDRAAIVAQIKAELAPLIPSAAEIAQAVLAARP